MKNTKTNTEITNVNNNTNKTNKEETTMTKTTKTNGRFKRTIASMLAAVMVMTTAATIGASANTDDVIKMNTRSAISRSASTSFTEDTKITVDEDTKMIVDLTSKTLFTFINECTPYGKFVTPALETLLGSFIGTPEDPTQKKLDEINDKLDKLFDKVDEAENSLKGFFCNELGVQSFYDDLINFKADAESINDTIQKTFKDTTLTNAQKLAKISEMIGSKTEWRTNFEKDLRVLNSKLAKPSVTAEGNIFELVYNHYCKDVMFSGEALDKAKPAFDFIMETYTASCTAIIEGLSAQRYLNEKLTDEEKASVQGYMSHICTSVKDIDEEIKFVSEKLTGVITKENETKEVLRYRRYDTGELIPEDWPVENWIVGGEGRVYCAYTGKGSIKVYPMWIKESAATIDDSATVKKMYDNMLGKSRQIIVEHGHTNAPVKAGLTLHDHEDDNWADGSCHKNMGTHSADNLNAGLCETNMFTGETVRRLAKYAADKGMTVRELLNANGFDTSYIPENANLITEKAWGKRDTTFWGQEYERAWYKGINIDKKGATETKVQFMDAGYDPWKELGDGFVEVGTFGKKCKNTHEWGYMKEGFVCALQKA